MVATTGPERADGKAKEIKQGDRYVGGRIRMRRLMLGMSQEKLAEGLGLTFQQVQKYEKGSNRVGASRLIDIARVLGTTPEWFFEGAMGTDGATPAGPDLEFVEFLNDGCAARLVRAFPKLSPDLRRSVCDLVEQAAR